MRRLERAGTGTDQALGTQDARPAAEVAQSPKRARQERGQAELPACAGYKTGAPQRRVAAEKSVRPHQLVGDRIGAVDKEMLASIYRGIWRALETGGMNRLDGQLAQDIGYTRVPVTVMMGDAIQATALLSEGRDHFFVRFYEDDDKYRVGTGIAGPFPIAGTQRPPAIDAATLAKLYRVMNDAAARGEMENLNGQLMQDIGYTPLEVSVPLGEEPVTATALISTPGSDHFFVRFYEENDPNRIGTGLAGPFDIE
jgi:hypothetical protein